MSNLEPAPMLVAPHSALAALPGTRGLWISAAVLAGLAMLLGGRLLSPVPAYADVASQAGEFAALTTDAGTDDLLIVLDQRAEALLVYHVKNQTSLEFWGREDLRDLFIQARRAAGR